MIQIIILSCYNRKQGGEESEKTNKQVQENN
jgi:hypothetical protein